MMGFDRTDDYQPLTYIKGRPLYVTTLVIALHAAAFIGACLVLASNQDWVLESLVFTHGSAVGQWQVWRFVSYAFVHTPGEGLSLLIGLFMLFQFGLEVEKYFGRKVFIAIYVALLLTPPLALAIISSLTGRELPLVGSLWVHFGVFVAFVTLHPNVQFFFGILAKWIVYAFVGINTLILLANHSHAGQIALWSSVAVAYFGTRQAGGGGGAFSLLNTFREQFPQRPAPVGVKPRVKPRRTLTEGSSAASSSSSGISSAGGGGDVYDSIDPLLDKISQHGLASLTNSERATLERARVSLLRKDRGG